MRTNCRNCRKVVPVHSGPHSREEGRGEDTMDRRRQSEAETMRYRWLRYRYAVVLGSGPGGAPAGGLGPVSEAWRTGRGGMTLAQTTWRPSTDVYETSAAIGVTIELAGVDEDELDVLLYEDALVIEGQRRVPIPPLPDRTGVY